MGLVAMRKRCGIWIHRRNIGDSYYSKELKIESVLMPFQMIGNNEKMLGLMAIRKLRTSQE
jgi:hypothetical protein